jgi:hyperosmotically inducible protein
MLAILAGVAVMGYNYAMGRGFTLSYPAGPGLDADTARQRGSELGKDAARKAGDAATKIEEVVGEGAVTAKIMSKMALDDYVKARAISVDTDGTVVTLSGVVQSDDERARAVRLARETAGVTQVIDKLEVKAP